MTTHWRAISAAARPTRRSFAPHRPRRICPAPIGWTRPPAATSNITQPESSDALAALYAANPQATLIAGATDIGLWVTKQLRDLPDVIFLNRCADLQQISETDQGLRIGAGVTMDRLHTAMADRHPSFAEMLRRFASAQIRAAATIGGNIANRSPIGDSPPPLIALDAQLHLRHGDTRRDIALENFFVDYGKGLWTFRIPRSVDF